MKVAENISFSVIQDGYKIMHPDDEFDMVCCLMTCHHFEKLDKMLEEIYRVLKPGGFLILREHDCTPENLSVFLDIVHGMYA